MIPAPGDVHYARTSKTATFSILETALPLVAKIELENGADGTWSSFNEFTVGDATYGEVVLINSPLFRIKPVGCRSGCVNNVSFPVSFSTYALAVCIIAVGVGTQNIIK